jgi:hypothetical protein
LFYVRRTQTFYPLLTKRTKKINSLSAPSDAVCTAHGCSHRLYILSRNSRFLIRPLSLSLSLSLSFECVFSSLIIWHQKMIHTSLPPPSSPIHTLTFSDGRMYVYALCSMIDLLTTGNIIALSNMTDAKSGTVDFKNLNLPSAK